MSDIIILISTAGGEIFRVLKRDVAPCSVTLRNLIEEMSGEDSLIKGGGEMQEKDAIPLPNITAATFKKVIDYCKEHATDKAAVVTEAGVAKPASLSAYQETTFDAEFIKDMTFKDIEPIVVAANYLDIRGLIDLCSRAIARAVQGKTPKEVFEYFGQEYKELSADERKKYEDENPFLKGE